MRMFVLKSVFMDTVYMNVIQLKSESEGPDYMLCDSIEDSVKCEQHRSCIINRVQEEDLSIENPYYRNVTVEKDCGCVVAVPGDGS